MLGNRESAKSEHLLKNNSLVKCFKVVSVPPLSRGSCPMLDKCVYINPHNKRAVNCCIMPSPYISLISKNAFLHEVHACSPLLHYSRSRGIQSFLLFFESCSCSLGRLLSDGRLEPPCCLASSRNLSKPNGSSSNWTGPSLPLPLVLRSELENSLSGTNLQEERWYSVDCHFGESI